MNTTLLAKYVSQHEGTERLAEILPFWPAAEREFVVYRGQHADDSIIRPAAAYSASISKDVAATEFSHESCCVFKIHVMPGIRFLDVNNVLGPDHKHADEEEILIEGGEFWQDKARSARGFTEMKNLYKGKKVFKTWLFPKVNPQEITEETLKDRIPEEEFELLKGDPLDKIVAFLHDTRAIKNNEVLSTDAISFLLSQTGGKRKTRRSRRR